MKSKHYKNVLITGAASLLLVACSSTSSVKYESLAEGVTMDVKSAFVLEIDEASAKDVEFGPRVQAEALDAMSDSLEARGATVADSKSEARYRMVFASIAQSEEDTQVSLYPENRIHSNYRGVVMPSGVIVTRRDYDVSREFGASLELGDYTSRVFMIDIYDLDTGMLIWRGHTRRSSGDLDEERVEAEIEKIVGEVPLSERV